MTDTFLKCQPVIKYFGMVYGIANQYSGDMASGIDASFQVYEKESDYWKQIPEYRRGWKGYSIYEVKWDNITKHIFYCKNLRTGEIVTRKSGIPCGILSRI